MEPLDRSTIWPYDERGEPRRVLLLALRQPDRRRGRGARSASSTAARRSSSRPGSGATTALVLSLLKPGDTIALAEGCYFGTGVDVPGARAAGACATSSSTRPAPPPDGVQLVWLEAPSNPFLTMPDLEAAAAHPAPVVVDSTVATPIHLRPLEHGADFVAAQRDEVPRRPRRRAARRRRLPRPGAADELRTLPHAHGHRRRARSGVAAAARPEDARGARRAARPRRRPTRRAAASASRRSQIGALPGLGGLLSFDVADGDAARRVETSTRADRERHLARRRHERAWRAAPAGRATACPPGCCG